MKRNLIYLMVLLFSVALQAQYNVIDGDSNQIEDGDVIVFGSYGTEAASMDFFVNNETADPINIKIEFVSALNADGSEFELCFGLCYTDIAIGNSYPFGSGNYVTIEGDGQSLPGNHFYNESDGAGNLIDYVFRFYMVDNDGNDIGVSKTFTYRYDPALSVIDRNKVAVELASTMVSKVLEIETAEELTAVIYNLQGQQVMQQNVEAGRQQIIINQLAAQSYLVVFTNAEGASKTIKFLKR